MRISDDIITDILSRTDMLQVVGQYVRLKKAGSTFKGLCPFHSEKTPSFNVNPERGLFKCFGCGVGGNLYTFLMQMEGWTFPETVRHLGESVGVQVVEQTDEESRAAAIRTEKKESYYKVIRCAQEWFEATLWGGRYPAALDYLSERGVGEETSRAFGLGYAPDSWSGLVDQFRKRGIDPGLAESAGLIVSGTKGHYDRFRHRLIFPIYDIWGKPLAFSGRIIASDPEKKTAKYINSPETPYYRKGRELFGLSVNKKAIRNTGSVLLVEGNFDVVTLHAKGIQNVVCPLGTALTNDQVKLLSRYSRKVYVAFDADKAGRAATTKSIPALVENSFDARVVDLPPGEDPDSLVKTRGSDALNDLITHAKPIVAFELDHILGGIEGAPVEVRVSALESVGHLLGHVSDKVTWDHYAQEVARRLEIPRRDVASYIKRPSQLAVAREKMPQAQSQPLPALEGSVLQVLSDMPDKLDEFVTEGCCQLLEDERLVCLLERVHQNAKGEEQSPEYALSAQKLANEIDDQGFFDSVTTLLSAEKSYDESNIERVYLDVICALQKKWLKVQEKRVFRVLAEALPGSREAIEAGQHLLEVHKVRRDLDVQLQRARPLKQD